jgi:glycine oxidase
MATSAEVLILGGGVIGLTTAYFLAREGVRVHVLDKGDFGQESSWAGAGILPPGNPQRAHTPFDLLRAHSASLFAELSRELSENTGIDNGYRRCGGLEFVGASAQAAAEEWRGEGIEVQALGELEVRKVEPGLAAGLGQALFLPDMAQLRNPRHLKALLAACQVAGVILTSGCVAHQIVTRDNQVQGVQTSAGILRAVQYVLATGAWTEPLLEPLGWQPGIHPVRGQIAMLHPEVPVFRKILLWGARYLVPRPDGRVLIGSTEEAVGFDKRTTAVAIHDLLQLGISLVPALAEAPLERCWAGLRPGSPDGLPYLGRVPGLENLFLAAGHFRAGIQLSPGTALLLKELLLGQPLTMALEPFRLDRNRV